mmetsp:Transcript_80217/g.141588  ORF Transcript_80217/g.141588 Transcript_80217/m.141588 type:complete len:271 (+) Transcript_80217:1295-2107(+)
MGAASAFSENPNPAGVAPGPGGGVSENLEPAEKPPGLPGTEAGTPASPPGALMPRLAAMPAKTFGGGPPGGGGFPCENLHRSPRVHCPRRKSPHNSLDFSTIPVGGPWTPLLATKRPCSISVSFTESRPGGFRAVDMMSLSVPISSQKVAALRVRVSANRTRILSSIVNFPVRLAISLCMVGKSGGGLLSRTGGPPPKPPNLGACRDTAGSSPGVVARSSRSLITSVPRGAVAPIMASEIVCISWRNVSGRRVMTSLHWFMRLSSRPCLC